MQGVLGERDIILHDQGKLMWPRGISNAKCKLFLIPVSYLTTWFIRLHEPLLWVLNMVSGRNYSLIVLFLKVPKGPRCWSFRMKFHWNEEVWKCIWMNYLSEQSTDLRHTQLMVKSQSITDLAQFLTRILWKSKRARSFTTSQMFHK